MSHWQPEPPPSNPVEAEQTHAAESAAPGGDPARGITAEPTASQRIYERGEAVETAESAADVEPVWGDAGGVVVEAEADGGLPSMAELDALSAELDEIDSTLARMDAEPVVDRA